MSWFKNAIANLYDIVSAPVDSKGVTLALFMGGVALKLCGEWKTNNAMAKAAKGGHVEIVKLCKEWGATDFNWAMSYAAKRGHVEIVKLCRGWLGFSLINDELFRYHHKREFSKRIHEELLPIAWHPNRVYDWCFDEEEKGFLEGIWRVADCASRS